MSGGGNPSSTEVQTTLDGSNFDTSSIPDLPFSNSYHCMAAGPDNTLYSVGGSAGYERTAYKLQVRYVRIFYLWQVYKVYESLN